MIKLLLVLLFTYASDDRGLRLAYGDDTQNMKRSEALSFRLTMVNGDLTNACTTHI